MTAARASERRLAFLADVGAVLAESNDHETMLRRVADVVVPRFADRCVADVMESGRDELTRVERMERRRQRGPTEARVLQQVLETRQPVHLASPADALPRASARSEPEIALLRELAAREVLIVPLEVRDRALGTLCLVMAGSGRRFEPADLILAREVGRRAGAAIDSARLLDEAEQAIQLRDEFMAMASHDMRTPLATVTGYLQLIRRNLVAAPGATDPVLVGMVDKADASVGRLTRLVADLLDVTLLQAGERLPMQLEAVDPKGLVQTLINERAPGTRSGRLRTDMADAVPFVTADRERLVRVLDNLVGNAMTYGAPDEPVQIRLAHEGEHVLISVQDEGPGIHADDLAHIFEPHFRGRNARQLPGSGLGLAGSRAVLAQMGGSLEASSEPGRGAMFTLRLPLAPDPSRRADPAP